MSGSRWIVSLWCVSGLACASPSEAGTRLDALGAERAADGAGEAPGDGNLGASPQPADGEGRGAEESDDAPTHPADRPECGEACCDSPIDCPPPEPCRQATCVDGRCNTAPWLGGCDDGDPCTRDDTCDAQGGCHGIADACGPCEDCDDGDPCTLDRCVPGGGCQSEPGGDGQPCDDADACTEGDACSAGMCQGDAVSCNDGNPCTDVSCDPSEGCAVAFNEQPCDDANACTQGDTCAGGSCLPGPPITCDDADACTLDSCDPAQGCVYTVQCCGALGLACPSGFECTAHDTCESDDDVFVPPGTFWQGKGLSTPWGSPIHRVMLDAFAIDRTEVTVGAYAVCVQAGACPFPQVPPASPPFDFPSTWYDAEFTDDYPINRVTWDEAQAYCAFVGKRLPTEAEWEKAARGGCEGSVQDCAPLQPLFPWGISAPITCDRAVFISIYEGGSGCGTGAPWPVGSKPLGMSPYGALDMAGNLSEWTADWWAADYYCHGPDAQCPDAQCFAVEWFCNGEPVCKGEPPYLPLMSNPLGPTTGVSHVVRGGGYGSPAQSCLVWRRSTASPPNPLVGVGFRCARSL